MPPKGPSHESQKHVNTHAFVPGRNIKLKEKDKAALAAAFSAACAGCCARCAGQLAWKQKYGKFKAAAPGAGPRRWCVSLAHRVRGVADVPPATPASC
jgi:hypothetical protein